MISTRVIIFLSFSSVLWLSLLGINLFEFSFTVVIYVLFAEYFHNKLVETIHFMEILNLKDSVEKDTFFRKLPNIAEQLPRQIVLKKVIERFSR